MTTVSSAVRIWLKRNPQAFGALICSFANYSAVARSAKKDIGGSIPAIKAALIRQAKLLRKTNYARSAQINQILKNSSVHLKSKVAVVISSDRLSVQTIVSAKGPSGWINVVDEKDLKKISSAGIKRIHRNVDMICIESPAELERTPGVLAFLLDSLAHEGVNVMELISVWKDTILIVHDADTSKVYSILAEKMK